MDIKVLVATHKKYRMPKEQCYMPVHVGKKGKESIGYIGDDTNINISESNAECESLNSPTSTLGTSLKTPNNAESAK